ncbi:glycoside hydrolase superfamily [Endogone sp. FLAS-F59071]|nr:glycoside hydrolase superfamily [Endogone sp. FLAS-F59071]|eukprot:RUS20393.1 glycoside hydrolase superfamily [Endogone sp. FLAS-F59071]
MLRFLDISFISDTYECGITGDCSGYGEQVQYCQSVGKKVLISIGGASANIVFTSSSDAKSFAQKIWNAYLGGTGDRPFGKGVIFNGIDLDPENNNPLYWGDFTTEIHSLFETDSKHKYMISAAPQPEPIESPDQNLVNFLENAWIDLCFIQFYNNPGYDNSDTLSMFTWWTSWATGKEKNKHNSKNTGVKLIYGLPGGSNTNDAGQGYQSFSQVKTQVANILKTSPQAFVGGGTWDDAWSYENTQGGINFLQNFKSALGSCSASTTKSKRDVTNSTTTDPSAIYYDRSAVTVDETATYKIIATGLKNAKGRTGGFQIRVHMNTELIESWSLTLPKQSRVISSSIGTVKRYRNSIIIASVSKKKLSTLRFTVDTRGGANKLDLKGAIFKTW